MEKLNPLLYININSKWIIHINQRLESMKLLGKNKDNSSRHQYYRQWFYFWLLPKAEGRKTKIDNGSISKQEACTQ